MTRRDFLACAASTLTAQTTRPKPPNIVFILADDLGYGDLGCYGQKIIQTPNLDRLASEGMRFTQVYAGSTVCAPSRCALVTGLHTGHCRIRGNQRLNLTPSDETIAKVLARRGYRTGLIGKWGLGTAGREGIPTRQGFDEFFGYLDQQHAHTYYPTHLWDNDREFFLPGNFGPKRTQYSHDLLTERAVEFVAKEPGRPFFLYLACTLPHANNELMRASGNGNEVPDDAPYSGRDWPQQDKNFAAMVTRLDRDVGRVLDKLKELGLDRDTVVMFGSDNGPHREGGHRPEFFNSNGPLRGIKRDLYEGGIRTPFIVRWPGTVQPGTVSDAVWAYWDVLPTLAEIAGARSRANLDGISVVPSLQGKPLPERTLYWEFHERGSKQAVRFGDWKAIRSAGKVEVYNLAADIGETRDVAVERPEIVKRAAALMDAAHQPSPDYPIKTLSQKARPSGL